MTERQAQARARAGYFGWHDITIHDGQISVAASLKKDELRALAGRLG